jgi:hypothetical protein
LVLGSRKIGGNSFTGRMDTVPVQSSRQTVGADRPCTRKTGKTGQVSLIPEQTSTPTVGADRFVPGDIRQAAIAGQEDG